MPGSTDLRIPLQGQVLHDPARLAALEASGLLDGPQPAFDRFARLAARLLDVPIATVSAVTTDRMIFSASVGLDVTEIPLSHSLCREVVISGKPLVIPDAHLDPVARDNPLVDMLGLVAYCGVPLRAPGGEVIGVVCCIAREPREWSPDDVAALEDLAAAAGEYRVGQLAYEDVLTGLPNRVELRRRLDMELARAAEQGGRVSVIYVDLDRFKLVNDVLGHAAGDALLRQAVDRIDAATKGEGFVARYGGDEFVILLGVDEANRPGIANAVASRVVAALDRPFELNDEEFEIGAYAGIAHHPWHGATSELLLEHADAAMRQAKGAGRRRVHAYQAGADDTARREALTLSARLRRAIAENELVLHFQPIVDLASGAASAFEALVRWQHPERGLLLPGTFIPQVEDTRLIEELGAWVIEAVCDQSAAWHRLRLEPRISFNVAPRQLRQPGFADLVGRAIAARDLDPAWFLAEITESAALEDIDLAGGAVRRLQALGAGTAIDDFGADYSSLGRLRGLAFDVLKIDRSFLTEVSSDPKAAAVVTAILSLASGLGVAAVAEGVETDAQRHFLIRSGCAFAQGFGLHRPMPAAAATELLLAQGPAGAGLVGRS
jgi:diguanylate cyclase (GGDEF)-like protein